MQKNTFIKGKRFTQQKLDKTATLAGEATAELRSKKMFSVSVYERKAQDGHR